jgi:glycosyltransferase involved in cell wall biosynthesis
MVVIGRNEGKGLRTSLSSALRQCTRVVCVDSGSIDDIPSLARPLGAGVVELDSSSPFTAAKARNAGFASAHLQRETLEVVQFLDEDCELADGWLDCVRRANWRSMSTQRLFSAADERSSPIVPFSASFCDLEWDGPTGEAKAFSGDVRLRMPAFREAGGFYDSLSLERSRSVASPSEGGVGRSCESEPR